MSKQKYEPMDAMVYPRFCGIPTFMRLPHITDLEDVDFAIAGVPFDTGATYRVGARFGPEGIRQHSRLLRPYNPVLNVELFKHLSGVDFGDLSIIPGYIQESFETITEQASAIFNKGVTPIFLGGDHSVSFPLLKAAAQKHGKLALIHFDSHSDLWEGYFGDKDMNGTPFRRALENDLLDVEHSIQIGLRGPLYDKEDYDVSEALGFKMISGPQLHEMGMKEAIRQIQERVGDRKAYVTFDIDFIDPAYAPGTGTPEVGGFTSFESLQLVRGLEGLNIVGFDLVEVMPAYDPTNTTCMLAANIVYQFISLIAKRRAELK
jgi:agmatinase